MPRCRTGNAVSRPRRTAEPSQFKPSTSVAEVEVPTTPPFGFNLQEATTRSHSQTSPVVSLRPEFGCNEKETKRQARMDPHRVRRYLSVRWHREDLKRSYPPAATRSALETGAQDPRLSRDPGALATSKSRVRWPRYYEQTGLIEGQAAKRLCLVCLRFPALHLISTHFDTQCRGCWGPHCWFLAFDVG